MNSANVTMPAGALASSGNTTLGNITALAGLRDDSRFIQISASVQPGNSGGPVLDEAGRLIGVIEGKLDALKVARVTGDIPQNVNFAILASTLAHFLEASRIPYEFAVTATRLPKRWTRGGRQWRLPDNMPAAGL